MVNDNTAFANSNQPIGSLLSDLAMEKVRNIQQWASKNTEDGTHCKQASN